jgi:hypothetical protein
MFTILFGKTGRTICLSAIVIFGCFSVQAEMEEAAITETPLINSMNQAASENKMHSHIPLQNVMPGRDVR